jgi:hypothetical protein
MGAAVAVVILLVGGSLWAVTRPSVGDDEAAPSTSTSESSTTQPSSASSTPSTLSGTRSSTDLIVPTGDATFDAGVTDIARFVEQARGHAYKQPVKVELVDDAEFNRRLLADFDKDADSMRTDEQVLKALELIPADSDYVVALRKTVSEGVLGFYDPETKELVVRGTELNPYIRETMAHELTHALDDQWFDLDRPELEDAPDESSWAFSALAEGSARAVEQQFDDTLTPAESSQRDDEEAQFGAKMDVSGVPDYILDSIGLPYQLGVDLVHHLSSSGGTAAIDAAFVSPPTTSKQVLDPDLLGRPPVPVDKPAADGQVIDEGVVGELGYLQLLHSSDSSGSVNRSTVDGWVGDHYVAYTVGSQTCVRDTVKVDSASDASTLESALRRWADGADHAEVLRIDDVTLTMSSCT